MKILCADGRIEYAVEMGTGGDSFRPAKPGECVDAPAPSYFCSFATPEEAAAYRASFLKDRNASPH